SETSQDLNSIAEDPLFVNLSENDFHLTENSPCIDAGDSINAPDFDFDGNPRPQGAGYDIGAYEYFNPIAIHENISKNFNLLNIYPNPFNESTVISYRLNVSGRASLKIYDMTGHEIRTLVNKKQETGKHSVVWDGTTDNGKPVGTGIYFCKLNINNKPVSTKKIMLLK
ncbi:MAG: T9SS type A sorting domain-containing protein, partial [Bacteroidales bacterium]|nr:T9SS type A sorting domain-containing protein [Bacteroidales bacterium]